MLLIGHYYLRGKKSKNGSKQAVVATARKLASIYYKLETKKVDFNPDVKKNSEYYLKDKLKQITKLKEKLEYSINCIPQSNILVI